jgi:hypothetical protein
MKHKTIALSSRAFLDIEGFRLEFVWQAGEKGRVQGKKDYISIETGDSKHGKGRMN